MYIVHCRCVSKSLNCLLCTVCIYNIWAFACDPQLQVALEDLYNGKTSKLAVQRNIICVTCKGIGGKEVGYPLQWMLYH